MMMPYSFWMLNMTTFYFMYLITTFLYNWKIIINTISTWKQIHKAISFLECRPHYITPNLWKWYWSSYLYKWQICTIFQSYIKLSPINWFKSTIEMHWLINCLFWRWKYFPCLFVLNIWILTASQAPSLTMFNSVIVQKIWVCIFSFIKIISFSSQHPCQEVFWTNHLMR